MSKTDIISKIEEIRELEELIEEAKNSIKSASSEGEAVAPELGW